MSQSSPSIGFASLLTLLFVGLKLTGFISWSWLWVLSPLWISFALALFIVAIVFVLLAVRG